MVSILNPSPPKCTILLLVLIHPFDIWSSALVTTTLFYCFKVHRPCHRATFFPISSFLCFRFYYTTLTALPSVSPHTYFWFSRRKEISVKKCDSVQGSRQMTSDKRVWDTKAEPQKRKTMKALTVKYWRSPQRQKFWRTEILTQT